LRPPDPPPAPRHPGVCPSLPARGYGCISSRARRAGSSLLAQYGDRLICVRYRYDPQRNKRFKAVELLGAECDREPPRPRFAHDQIVWSRVAFADVAICDRVTQAGGTWDPVRRVWQVRYDRVVALGLTSRIVDEPASNSGCPGASDRISMQMPGRHPGRDARIHWWMPASRGR